MSESTYSYGRFVWRELCTTDLEAARRFYGELAGWDLRRSDMPDMEYWLAHAGERQVAGFMSLPRVPPHWNSYVSVPDVDAAVKAATEAGGVVVHGPRDIEGVGRLATLHDPQGAVFSVFHSASGDSPTMDRPKRGEFCWEQLNAADLEGAKAFYAKVAGWQVSSFQGMDTFGVGDGPSNSVASLMAAPPGQPPHWLTFFVVDKVADANARAARLGATVLMERIEVPQVGSFSVLRDPAGAVVCPYEPLPY